MTLSAWLDRRGERKNAETGDRAAEGRGCLMKEFILYPEAHGEPLEGLSTGLTQLGPGFRKITVRWGWRGRTAHLKDQLGGCCYFPGEG